MSKNLEGKRVPDVTFKLRRDGDWVEVTSADLFAGRKVVLFALPGAFTPTCSTSHVPRYNELAPLLESRGVDEIVCLSVNDAFVMEAWQADQNAERIRFVADGNGSFTDAMGMLVDKRDLGFGKRSWRYSMVVDDGVIEKMFVEPELPGDPFEVSDADTMLRHIDPRAEAPSDVMILTKAGCPHCARAKRLLLEQELTFHEWELNQDFTLGALRALTGADTVPQVFIDGERIGGADALAARFPQALAA